MKISATFSDGTTISRNTKQPLTYAYKSINIYQTFTGFATSEELARKAASSLGKKVPKPHTIEVVKVDQQ
jgi:hypothetical protein